MDATREDKNPRRLDRGPTFCDSSALCRIGLLGGRAEKHIFTSVFPLGRFFSRYVRSARISQILLFGAPGVSGGNAFEEFGRDVPVFDSSLRLVAKGDNFATRHSSIGPVFF